MVLMDGMEGFDHATISFGQKTEVNGSHVATDQQCREQRTHSISTLACMWRTQPHSSFLMLLVIEPIFLLTKILGILNHCEYMSIWLQALTYHMPRKILVNREPSAKFYPPSISFQMNFKGRETWFEIFKPGTPACSQRMPGFLKLFLCGRLYVCVRLPSRLLITSGVMWHDMDPI